jgi:tetratricopeptide (TPR) repeat protein
MKHLAVALVAVALCAVALAQPDTAHAQGIPSILNQADMERAADPQTAASRHYTRGLGYLRKADKAEAKGKDEKVTKYLERATDAFKRAIGEWHNLPEAHAELGCTLLRLGELEPAETALASALAMDPGMDRAEECNEQLLARHREEAKPGVKVVTPGG